MRASYLSLGIVLATPVIVLGFHALLSRTWAKKIPRQKAALVSCLLGTVTATYLALVTDFYLVAGDGKHALFFVVVSAMLAHLYFHVFNMSETARRIRLLLDLRTGLAPDKISYGDQTMVSARLERLFELRQIEERNGKIHSRPTLLRLACRFVEWHERMIFPSRLR